MARRGVRASGRWRAALTAVAVCAVLFAGAGALALYLAPRVLPNLQSEVVAADTVEEFAAPGIRASVTVPAGWLVRRDGTDAAALTLRTPDGGLTVTLRARDVPVADAFTAVAPRADAAVEVLAGGSELRHADDPDAAILRAAVGRGAAPSVTVVAEAARGAVTPYRAALSLLLESVRVRS